MTLSVRDERKSDPSGMWTDLRPDGDVAADEVIGDDVVEDNYIETKGDFIDLKITNGAGALDGTHNFQVTVVEIDDHEVPGTDKAYPLWHAFKDGSTSITVTTECILKQISATGKVGIWIHDEAGTATIRPYIRSY